EQLASTGMQLAIPLTNRTVLLWEGRLRMLKFVCRPSGPRSAPQLLGAIIAGTALLVSSSVASAATIAWAIDSSQSSITLDVPDQSVSLGGTTATIRLRDAGNNNQWTQGRTAAVAGTLVTDYVDGVSIEFL